MPDRRIHSEGTYAHYVTFSCYHRRRLLDEDKCKRVVVGELGLQLRRHDAICVGFVVMPDHVHAIMWFREEHKISDFMEDWKTASSESIAAVFQKEFPKYWRTIETKSNIWQPRYYDYNIYSDDKLREKLDYMHNNPIRAGLVKDICDWTWSSARAWHQGKSVGVPVSWPG